MTPLRLWYPTPAAQWVEALPLGNGRIGAMVFGGTATERVALNEDTLWSGPPPPWNNPDALGALPHARQAALEGRYEDAARWCQKMQGPWTQSYLPFGDLFLDFDLPGDITAYERDLTLDDAVSRVRYTAGGVTFTRETWVSAPDQVLVMRLTTDTPGTLSFAARLESPLRSAVRANADRLIVQGTAPTHVSPNYVQDPDPIRYTDGDGIQFAGVLHLENDGGALHTAGEQVRVTGADAVTLRMALATSWMDADHPRGQDPLARAQSHLASATAYNLDQLRARHVAEHQAYFRRVQLDLGANTIESDLSTDTRIARFHETDDPALATLLFQYGRYLLIASSRPGTQPANLQGIWNQELRPPWSSNYTLNINAQMNYWPAETANLSKCHTPLLDFIADLAVKGAETAHINYGCGGWVAHHNSDVWRQSAPVGVGSGEPAWANWQMGGAWLARHLWEHYRFTGDTAFLARVWPLLRGASQFGLDWLTEDGNDHLVTAPSTSPEHGFVAPDGQRSAVSVGSTMDLAILRDLFDNTVAAAQILNTEPDFARRLQHTRARLLPMQTNAQGQLLEFYRDFADQEPHHRHVSHLYGVFPGSEITPNATPEWCDAARRSLEIRGDAGTGWSLGWKINLWARLGDGDHAYRLVRDLLTLVDTSSVNYQGGGGVYANLFDAHPPFQIDGNFAFTSGVIEMLLQSHSDHLHLLPALPPIWPNGSVQGLRARGGFVVGLTWQDSTLIEVRLESLLGSDAQVRYGDKIVPLALAPGQTAVLDGNLQPRPVD